MRILQYEIIALTLALRVQSLKPKPTALKRFSTILCLIIALSGGPSLYAQYEREGDATIPLEYFYIERKKSGLRTLLSKVYFGLSTGYGSTPFRHKLDGFGIAQQPNSSPLIFDHDNLATRYSNWTNNVAASNETLAPGSFLVNSDSSDLGFRSKTFVIPLKATLHLEFDRYRIGGGYSIAYSRIGSFAPTNFESNISSYSLEKPTVLVKHYFGMLGAMVYRYDRYAAVVDANIGGYSLGDGFAKNLMKKSLYVNLGVTLEKQFSEYFRLFIRPSYEVKSYKLTIPETAQSLQHRIDGFYINLGFTYRLPELRRCFLKSCHAQINHAHGNREYRSRRHPIYKKQNPNYGENYPELIKYKGKNKKKLNPY
jgi:hypothetical protein